ncbi:hypothetical protein, partial [Paenibacillus sp. P32E]|uniref:hypothetical protein n=1 Tax=Paenibacillus sp. P32E TaxID=1349434 RepID=UPI0011612F19
MKNLFFIAITTLFLFSLNVISMDFDFTKNVNEWAVVLIFIFFVYLVELFSTNKPVNKTYMSQDEAIFLRRKNKSKSSTSKKSIFIFIWLSLALCMIFSKILNHDNLSSIVFLLFSVPIFFIYKVPKINEYKNRILYPSAILSYLPFLIVLFYIISRDGRNNVVGVLTSFTGII